MHNAIEILCLYECCNENSTASLRSWVSRRLVKRLQQSRNTEKKKKDPSKVHDLGFLQTSKLRANQMVRASVR